MSQQPEPTGVLPQTRVSDRRTGHYHPRRQTGKRRLLSLFAALALVALGAVIGCGLTIIYFRNNMTPRPPQPDEMADRILTRMHRTFPVEADEDAEIRRIVLERMTEIKELRRSSFRAIREQFDGMNDDLLQVLGPDRHQKWKNVVEESRQKHRRDRKDDGKPASSKHESGGHHR